jgi:hypothetical protein
MDLIGVSLPREHVNDTKIKGFPRVRVKHGPLTKSQPILWRTRYKSYMFLKEDTNELTTLLYIYENRLTSS